jgi:hypothetical protein
LEELYLLPALLKSGHTFVFLLSKTTVRSQLAGPKRYFGMDGSGLILKFLSKGLSAPVAVLPGQVADFHMIVVPSENSPVWILLRPLLCTV